MLANPGAYFSFIGFVLLFFARMATFIHKGDRAKRRAAKHKPVREQPKR